jgi:hypothetical protein
MDPVTNDGSNSEATHLAGGIGDDPTLIVEYHAEPAVRQHLIDRAFDRQQLFFRHAQSSACTMRMSVLRCGGSTAVTLPAISSLISLLPLL